MLSSNSRRILILLFLSFVFLMFGNNFISLTNPDEVFYAGTAKEMIQQKTWLIPFLFGKPQFEKPIFTYWLLRLGFLMFGISNFGARLFPALFAMLGIMAVYFFCRQIYGNSRKAFICAFILMTSGFYIGLARTVFTDMIFSIFILLSLGFFFLGYLNKITKRAGILLYFVFLGFAVLTKGPLGFFIPSLVIIVFLAAKKEISFLFCKYSIWGFLLFILVASPWYCFMFIKFGNSFIQEFFYNDHIRRFFEAEHKGNDRWYFYPSSMVFTIFPWSIFTLAALLSLLKRLIVKKHSNLDLFLFCWVLVFFLAFQPAHSKLVSYIFPLFPALAVMTGDFIYEAVISNKRLFRILSLITATALLLLPLGLVWANLKYPTYVGSWRPIYGFFVIFIIFIATQFIILKRNSSVFPYVLACCNIIILFFVFLYHQKFEDYLSSKHAADYILSSCSTDSVILCSKPFVRGIRFYTNREVAVINIGGKNFFSPHPIPFLDTEEKVTNFFQNQHNTCCVLRESSLKDLECMIKNKYILGPVKKIGNEYIVTVQTIDH